MIESIRKSDRYQFLHTNLLDIPQIQRILIDKQVELLEKEIISWRNKKTTNHENSTLKNFVKRNFRGE